jgi:putative ABC transport system substrate-binding protein
MNKRDTLFTLLALGAAPLAAQERGKLWRIGVLAPTVDEAKSGETSPYAMAFFNEMKAAGYAFGMDYVIETRSANGDYERLPALAKDLVRINVDIIIALTPVAIGAAHRATRTVPIVCIGVHDPVGQGLAASLARPGGNLTGLASFYAELVPKHLELLKLIVPKASRVAILSAINNGGDPKLEQRIFGAADKLGLRLQILPGVTVEQLPRAFAAMTRERADAVIAVADAIFFDERRQLAELALKHRLPSFFANHENVQAGGLLSYGEDFFDMFAQSAKYVSKIMKGAKPGDLPIEQPTKFHLAINRKTAAALKLTIPQELLLRADEVIE